MNDSRLSRREMLALAIASAASFACDRRNALAAASAPGSVIHGVKIGAQTYSFHEIPIDGADHADQVVADLQACGLTTCELFGGDIDKSTYVSLRPPSSECPKPEIGCAPGKGGSERNAFAWAFGQRQGDDLIKTRHAIRTFLESKPAPYYEAIRRRFDDAGIEIYTYNPFLDPGRATPTMPTTDAELDGIFYAAKALGVKAINASINRSFLKRVLPFAE